MTARVRNRLRRGALHAFATVLALTVLSSADATTAAPAFTPNHLFVGGQDAVTNAAAVFEFDEAGSFVRKIPVPTTSMGDHLYGVAFGPDGALYCASLLTSAILRIDASLTVTSVFAPSVGLAEPNGIAFGPQGYLYVANRIFGGALIVADLNGVVVNSYRPVGSSSPSYVAFGPEGHVYLSLNSNEIQELDADLRFVRSFGTATISSYPANVVFGRDGVVYVADFGGNQVRRFSADGAAMADLPTTGLNNPFGDALGPDGNLYVSNFSGHEVVVLNPATGATVRTMPHPDLNNAAGVAFAPYRFQSKLKGTLVGTAASASKLGDPNSVLSFSPGSGTVMIALTDAAGTSDVASVFSSTRALVFHGVEVASSDGKSLLAQGASVSRHDASRSVGSSEILVKGSRSAIGFFVPKSLAGSIHLGRPGAGLVATLTASKRVP